MRDNDAIRKGRQMVGTQTNRGYLGRGDTDKTVIVADGSGKYWVRIVGGNEEITAVVQLHTTPGVAIPVIYNLPIIVGYDESGERVITKVDRKGMELQNVNPRVTNPADTSAQGLIKKQRLSPFYTRPHPSASKSLYALTYPALIIEGDGNVVTFAGNEIDLEGAIPSAGNHRYTMVLWTSAGLEIASSTAQATGSALDDTDLEECIANATVGAIPIWAFVLTGGDTALDSSDSVDCRQLFGSNTVTGSDVYIDFISGATYQTLQDFVDTGHHAGYISGGAITDNGDGTIDVAAGTGMIRTSNSDTARLKFFDWAASAGVSLVDDDSNYVYVDYNAGSPQIATTTTGADVRDNENDKFELAEVYRDGTTLHISNHRQRAGNAMRYLQQRLYSISKITRASAEGGLILSETGTRNLAVTAGKVWIKLDPASISAIDTSGADSFDRYYQDGVGGWTKQAGETQWDNQNYDDGDGTLGSLSPNKYSAQYFYIEPDGSLVSLYGQNAYNTLAQAEDDPVPTTIPGRIEEHALLIGRVIFQYNDSSAQAVESAFEVVFSTTGASDHGNLAGLSDDDHSQYALLAGRSGGQTLIGGSDASDNLTLQSTSNATRGDIIASDDVDMGDNNLLKAGFVELDDLGGAPVTPASGYGRMYVNADVPYFIDDGGNSYKMALEVPAQPTVGQMLMCSIGNTWGILNLGTTGNVLRAGTAVPVYTEPGGITVENASGGAASTNDVGYIGEDGKYYTTTTANFHGNGAWCVVLYGAANGSDILVQTEGKCTAAYDTGGTTPSTGDYLITTTTAGEATPQSYVSPNIFAVCTANGSGGTVAVLLLTKRKIIPIGEDDSLLRIDNHSGTEFAAQINAAGSGGLTATNVPYDNITGHEDSIAPNDTGELGKLVLINTDDSNSERLITAVDTGNNAITTVSSTDSWADNDAIQVKSVTNTDSVASEYFYDVQITSTAVPELTVAIMTTHNVLDTAGNIRSILHPWETGASGKRLTVRTQVNAIGITYAQPWLALINRKFCILSDANGASSKDDLLRLVAVTVAAP